MQADAAKAAADARTAEATAANAEALKKAEADKAASTAAALRRAEEFSKRNRDNSAQGYADFFRGAGTNRN